MPHPISDRVRKALLGLFGVALGIGLLWLAVRNIEPGEFRRLGIDVDRRWILASVLAYGASIFVRTLRWRSLLNQLLPVARRQVAATLIVGYAVNYALLVLFAGLTMIGIGIDIFCSLRGVVGIRLRMPEHS